MSYQSEGSDALGNNDPLPTPPTPSSGGDIAGKKKLHMAFFIILLIIAGVAAFAAFFNFCISLSQVTPETTLPNGSSIFAKPTSSCDDVKKFLPLRWEIASQRDDMMMCPWPASNSGFRCVMCILAMADVALFVLALKNPENPIINWSFIGSCGFLGLMFLIVTIVDGVQLTNANKFCEDGMPELAALFNPGLMKNNTFGIECFPEPFTGLMFANVFVLICFPALAAYFFFYHRRTHKSGESTIPDDDETKPLAAAPQKKKVFVASEITDESLTQDVTGANPFDPRTGLVDNS